VSLLFTSCALGLCLCTFNEFAISFFKKKVAYNFCVLLIYFMSIRFSVLAEHLDEDCHIPSGDPKICMSYYDWT